MDDSDIVEIYSAANSLEAYALANALKADGIEAKVVNEFVQMGVGLLPLIPNLLPPESGFARVTRSGPGNCLKNMKPERKMRI